ncbi:SpoIIE family protein phosphatase [Streptomyces niveus]|uniref:SpoIIE family protein phosphatase n=1 Tax=Streptomyces niveus TaxID=193462 RepID=UPI001EED4219|nr:SpoIIE family protein phosphatase [Streptomyces niveus]
MRILAAVGEDVSETEALRCALHHAVAGLGGPGGMVHLRSLWQDTGLHLMLTDGLPPAGTKRWQDLSGKDTTVPARAARSEQYVWLPAPAFVGRPPDHGRAAAGPPDGSEQPQPPEDAVPSVLTTCGLASVPLLAPTGPLGLMGVLSVLTPAAEEPTAEQRAFLEEVARWAAGHLARSLAAPRGSNPELWPEPPNGSRLQQALKAVRVGAWDWNIRTGELDWDEAAMTVLGVDPTTFDHRIETWLGLVHPEDLPWVMLDTDEAIRTRTVYAVEYRVCRPDGTFGWAQARARVILGDDGEPHHMVGTVWDTTQTHVARESVDHALRHMSDGFFAVDTDWRVTFINIEAQRALGSSHELLGRVLWDIPFSREPGLEVRCRQAVANHRPVGLDVLSPANRRWYHLRLVPAPGGLTVYLTDVTDKRAREAERTASERAAAERAARTGELTTALSEALTTEDVVKAVAQHVMQPFRATGLVVVAFEGEHTRLIGSVGYEAADLEKILSFPLTTTTPVSDVLSTRAPLFISSLAEMKMRYPALADVPTPGRQAWAFLPLIASGRSTGCCVISFDRPRLLGDEERTLLVALSGLFAQALERARLYDSEHLRAKELQRGLLPRHLPSPPAATAAARYLPSDRRLDVGGDWYDLIPLSAERVALVIGDVMGHGLSEAATMGRLRTAVRTLADLELPPDEILGHLNGIVSDLGDDFYATCLYAVYDPTTHTCVFASAGHLPPVVVHPDHTARVPEISANPPLGAAVPPFDTVELAVPDGSLLALFTDGLVEAAGRDIEAGTQELMRVLTGALRDDGDLSLDQLCDTVVSALLPAGETTTDDAVLFIARLRRLAAEDIASWSLPQDPVAAGQAREHVRDQLDAWHLDDLAMTTELLASELVSNVIRHAQGPVRLRLLRGRTLVCEVSDGSLTTPHVRRASATDESGRGLQLVSALAQRWGARYTASGKSIWTEQPLPAPPPTAPTAPTAPTEPTP